MSWRSLLTYPQGITRYPTIEEQFLSSNGFSLKSVLFLSYNQTVNRKAARKIKKIEPSQKIKISPLSCFLNVNAQPSSGARCGSPGFQSDGYTTYRLGLIVFHAFFGGILGKSVRMFNRKCGQ